MMKTNRPFRWRQANPDSDNRTRQDDARPGRHAYPAASDLADGDTATAICGQPTTIASDRPGWWYPECQSCDRIWRDVEGIRSVYDPPSAEVTTADGRVTRAQP